jgi:hypothetical protein
MAGGKEAGRHREPAQESPATADDLKRSLAKDLPTEKQRREGLTPDQLNTRNDE